MVKVHETLRYGLNYIHLYWRNYNDDNGDGKRDDKGEDDDEFLSVLFNGALSL
jgi:hypothetical protein